MFGVEQITTTEQVALVSFDRAPAGLSFISSVFESFAQRSITIDMISQTPTKGDTISLAFTVMDEDLRETLEVIQQLRQQFAGITPMVSASNAKIQLFGEPMREMSGVAARALTALAATDTHIALITTSEVDISLLVSESSLETALNALTQAFAVTTA